MTQANRREFLETVGLGGAAVSILAAGSGSPALAATPASLELGMASYSFRKFSTEKTLEMTKRLGLKKIAFKDMHLPLDSTPDKIKAVAAQAKSMGLDLYGCGVVYMQNEAEVDRAFEYAKAAGMRVIIGVPDHPLLPRVNQKVQSYDIRVAIHNHGPGDKRYPTPQSVYDKIKDLDHRIGFCIDVGHTQRMGIDPSEVARKYTDRLYDVHIKDVDKSAPDGDTVEIGRGVIDIPKFLRTLIEIKYSGSVSLEYEKDENDPLPGAAESIGYLRGVLAVI